MTKAYLGIKKIISKYHSIILAAIDTLSILACYTFTWVMLNGRVSLTEYRPVLIKSAIIFTVIFILFYYITGMYNSIWRYAGVTELFKCATAAAASVIVFVIVTKVFGFKTPISSFMLSAFFSASLTLYYRAIYRLYRNRRSAKQDGLASKRIMLVGAGSTGAALISEFNRGKNRNNTIVCAVDDDRQKVGKTLLGVKIVGRVKDAKSVASNYNIDTILLAIPSASQSQKSRVISICSRINDVRLLTLPDITELVMNEDNYVSKIRDVRVEDLLGRDVIKVDEHSFSYLKARCVMVTGGGGSIGSELCRQIAAVKPKLLIIVDIYENNAYDIQQELIRKYGNTLNLKVIVASVRDSQKMDKLFSEYRPEVVFHAAAHKHVPLMEDVPEEAVKNNIYGTLNVARCASKYGAVRFVMISTDKAVNPTSIMGATKRVCEMIIQSMNKISKTEFVAVRFGNVLGSNGSVIPLFKKEIEAGGPVTITHPDIIRYFMTISEAVNLVLTAGEMAEGGEIFVLDMGEPVKIQDLAENLIRLSGFEPGEDIKIVYTGLRPGEKLYEELLMGEEGLKKTPNDKIYIGEPINIDVDYLFTFLDEYKLIAKSNDSLKVVQGLHKLVPTFVQTDKSLYNGPIKSNNPILM